MGKQGRIRGILPFSINSGCDTFPALCPTLAHLLTLSGDQVSSAVRNLVSREYLPQRTMNVLERAAHANGNFV